MTSGGGIDASAGMTRCIEAFLCSGGQFREHFDASGGHNRGFRDPAETGDHLLVPFLWEIDSRPAWQSALGALVDSADRGGELTRRVRRPCPAVPICAPSVGSCRRCRRRARWLAAWTATLARINSATMSACKSEKVSTRISGLEAQNLRHVVAAEYEVPGRAASPCRTRGQGAPHSPTRRRCEPPRPRRYNVSTVSSVRQTIEFRDGGNAAASIAHSSLIPAQAESRL